MGRFMQLSTAEQGCRPRRTRRWVNPPTCPAPVGPGGHSTVSLVVDTEVRGFALLVLSIQLNWC